MTATNDNMDEDEQVVEQHFITCALALLRHRGATDREAQNLTDIIYCCLEELEDGNEARA